MPKAVTTLRFFSRYFFNTLEEMFQVMLWWDGGIEKTGESWNNVWTLTGVKFLITKSLGLLFGVKHHFFTSERVDPETPHLAGKKELKESASHHLIENYLFFIAFWGLGVLSVSIFHVWVDAESRRNIAIFFALIFQYFRGIFPSDAVAGWQHREDRRELK